MVIINEQNLIKQALGMTNVFEDSSNLNRNLDGFASQLDAKNQQIDKLHTLLDQQRQLILQSNKQIDKSQLQLETKEEEKHNPDEVDISNVQQQLDQLKGELKKKFRE